MKSKLFILLNIRSPEYQSFIQRGISPKEIIPLLLFNHNYVSDILKKFPNIIVLFVDEFSAKEELICLGKIFKMNLQLSINECVYQFAEKEFDVNFPPDIIEINE